MKNEENQTDLAELQVASELEVFPEPLDEEKDENAYSQESILLEKIETQMMSLSETCIGKYDWLEFYLTDILKLDTDKFEPYQFEMQIENEYMQNSWFCIRDGLKNAFKNIMGIDFSDYDEEKADFEFIKLMYNTFVLDFDKLLLSFLNGLSNKGNKFVQDPNYYTLAGGYSSYYKKLSQESLDIFAKEAFDPIQMSKEVPTDMQLKDFVLSSVSFSTLIEKSFYDSSLTDFDTFFDIVALDEHSIEVEQILKAISSGNLPLDYESFKIHIDSTIKDPNFLNYLEDEYRKINKLTID